MTPETLAKGGSEHAHQTAFFAWLGCAANYGWEASADPLSFTKPKHAKERYGQSQAVLELRWVHAIPNGGDRDGIVAANMVAEGARSGVWDIHVPIPIGSIEGETFPGMYIEMKKPGRQKEKFGGLSNAQINFGKHLKKLGYAYFVAYSWTEARDALYYYMKGRWNVSRNTKVSE